MTMMNPGNSKPIKYKASKKGVNAGMNPTTSPEKVRKATAKANHKACMHKKGY